MPQQLDPISAAEAPCFAWGLVCVDMSGQTARLCYLDPGLSAVLDGAAVGMRLAELVLPEDLALLHGRFGQDEQVEVQLRLLQKAGGEPLHILFRGVRRDGLIWGVVAPAKGNLLKNYERLQEWFGGFRTLLQSSNQQAYEWDIVAKTLHEAGYQSVFWREMMRTDPLLLLDENGLPAAENIYTGDRHAFLQLHQSILAGGAGGTIEMRMLTGYGIYRWCRLTLTTIYDSEGAPRKAVGLLTDIEHEKREAIRLESRAQQDGLTGLYNGVAFREKLNAMLEREKGSRMALYVVQIDAYSELLHRVGWVDARGVLIHAASCITALSGEEALCGRIGEATFAVLRCVANSEQGLHAGTCYCEELLQTTPEGMQSIPVTASVGMVLILEDGIDATELFHAADVALGVAMQQSGTMVCYTPGLEREGVVSGIHFGGAEDAEGGFDNTLLYTFFNRLYGGGDSERSMEQVLRMAGEHYHASRAYIYRLDEEDATISHLMCEWRTEETEPLRSTEKTAKLLFLEESCGEYADGRFYCENMETLSAAAQKRFKKQEVKSVLQFPVVQDGVCFAAIGFHVCNDKRLWNDSERESLALAAKLLGGFLLRVHAKEHASRRDPLTGLQLYGRFRQNAARRLLGEPDSNWQMVCLDVVRFRDINELFGTATGDLLLMRFARQMRMRLADGELACRLTANRYAVLLRRKPGLSAKDRLEAFLKHFDPVRRSLIGTHGLTLAAGVVDVQPDQTIDTLLDMARLACKKAKQSGMLCCYYGEEQNRQYELREKICAHQQDALQNKEFQLYLQPTFSAQGQQVIGADAWVRWNNRSAGQLRTSQFLPVFQENGFVLDLDYELMGQICAAIASWPETCRVPITLRIDRLHFAMTDFISRLCEICEKHGVAHRYIGLEIPENAFLGDKTRLQQVLRELKRQKFYLVLGSFGSGWSSLETLTDYPFDALRLSTDFFDEAVGKKHLVAENICAMAKNLGLRVFAAGVATAQQAEFLHRIGVDAVQGDYYRPTLSAAEYRTEICKMRR